MTLYYRVLIANPPFSFFVGKCWSSWWMPILVAAASKKKFVEILLLRFFYFLGNEYTSCLHLMVNMVFITLFILARQTK